MCRIRCTEWEKHPRKIDIDEHCLKVQNYILSLQAMDAARFLREKFLHNSQFREEGVRQVEKAMDRLGEIHPFLKQVISRLVRPRLASLLEALPSEAEWLRLPKDRHFILGFFPEPLLREGSVELAEMKARVQFAASEIRDDKSMIPIRDGVAISTIGRNIEHRTVDNHVLAAEYFAQERLFFELAVHHGFAFIEEGGFSKDSPEGVFLLTHNNSLVMFSPKSDDGERSGFYLPSASRDQGSMSGFQVEIAEDIEIRKRPKIVTDQGPMTYSPARFLFSVPADFNPERQQHLRTQTRTVMNTTRL